MSAAAKSAGVAHDGGSRASMRPNIILILADDMGFSDIGCYGSEIDTPNLDKLAAGGLRFTQFYNNPRCCPSRACLLTGLYPHQAGMGLMADDYGRYPYPSYAGDLSSKCVTIAEALHAGGYNTAMAGKWHLTPTSGVDNHNWPLQRGFQKYFGTIAGAGSYYAPVTLTRDNAPIEVPKDFYYTDAIAENAANYVEDFAKKDAPFFLYAAFTAPHWPLQALDGDIAKYKDRYRQGWDHLRLERHGKQLQMGIMDPKWQLTARDLRVPPWELASYKEWEMQRMAVFAAQVDRLDQGIGKIVARVNQMGIAENTLVLFMSDNGGNYEEIEMPGPDAWKSIFIPQKTEDGRPVRRGNDPKVMPGAEDTYESYGIPWGNCSNTPFRLYKHFAHEGGISTPLVAYWPAKIKHGNSITHQIGHETDIMASCLDAAGVQYPARSKSGEVPPALVGKTLLPILEGKVRPARGPIFWEHHGNCAMRDGKWKLVSQFPDYWELYDMEADRTELHNIADQHLDRVKAMAAAYAEWAKFVGVLPWPMPQTPPAQQHFMDSADYLRDDRI
jgi:arylsulfatase